MNRAGSFSVILLTNKQTNNKVSRHNEAPSTYIRGVNMNILRHIIFEMFQKNLTSDLDPDMAKT